MSGGQTASEAGSDSMPSPAINKELKAKDY